MEDVFDKRCPKCSTWKLSTEFYKDKKTKTGLKSWCKDCHLESCRKSEPMYKETRRLYRLNNQEEYRASKRKYFTENKEKVLHSNKMWRQTFKGRLLSYKRSALARGIEWNMTDEEFKSFWGLNCHYCNGEVKTIGLDRIDSTKDYNVDNIVSCCSTCNKMKMELPYNVFIDQVQKIYFNTTNR